MKGYKLFSKKAVFFVVIGATALTFLLLLLYISSRDAQAAAHLLKITNALTLGDTTRQQFLALSKPYRRYLLSEVTSEGLNNSRAINYRFYGYLGKPVVMSISIGFSGDVVVGRTVGILQGDCCSVETRQRLDAPTNRLFGTHRVIREIVGDDKFMKLEVAPNISGQALSNIFDYQAQCLLPFYRCDSVEKLNPKAAMLLRQSGTPDN